MDNNRKALLISSGLTKKVKKLRKEQYKAYLEYDNQKIIDLEFIFCCENKCSIKDIEDCDKINRCDWKRNARVFHKVSCILEYEESPLFLTLTFNDETLKNTTKETRRRYITAYLKSQSCLYVANIDYGAKNDREHYHALVVGKVDYKPWHKYGAVKGIQVPPLEDDIKRVSKYISKLTNHAIKNTTKGNRVIYSR